MNARKIIARLLMTFLLVSIGVAIGKELAARELRPTTTPAAQSSARDKIIVYYMHGLPCTTCTFVEQTVDKLVHEEFATEVAQGRMEFMSVNFLQPQSAQLADRYSVGSNMVIAVRQAAGQEVSQVRLEKVLELAQDEQALEDYVRSGIRQAQGAAR